MRPLERLGRLDVAALFEAAHAHEVVGPVGEEPRRVRQPAPVDVVVAVRVTGRASAFGVAEPGVETRCLEGVRAQGHPVAAAAPDLGFGGGQEPGAQAGAALVVAHPQQLDVTAAAPGPPGADRHRAAV